MAGLTDAGQQYHHTQAATTPKALHRIEGDGGDNSKRITISTTIMTTMATMPPPPAESLPAIAMATRKPNVTGVANGVSIGTKPTLIDAPPMHFLIMDAPRQSNLHVYIRDMSKHAVAHVVRFCEPTYQAGELQSAGMTLHEMEYKDGTSPPKELIQAWLELVDKTFYSRPPAGATTTSAVAPIKEASDLATTTSTVPSQNGNKASVSSSPAIAVHCVAGLGRAPVMVAIALIEFAGMDPVEAVSLIRANRRGAINEKQLLYLEGYKKQYKRRGGGNVGVTAGSKGCGCVIS